MSTPKIVKQTCGIAAVQEARELIGAFERLGFEMELIEVFGPWRIGGDVVTLDWNVVGIPKRKIELAPGVFIDPTEKSIVQLVGYRDEEDAS